MEDTQERLLSLAVCTFFFLMLSYILLHGLFVVFFFVIRKRLNGFTLMSRGLVWRESNPQHVFRLKACHSFSICHHGIVMNGCYGRMLNLNAESGPSAATGPVLDLVCLWFWRSDHRAGGCCCCWCWTAVPAWDSACLTVATLLG